MKKTYESPSIEKVAFMYRDQVVAASGFNSCTQTYAQQDLNHGCAATGWNGDMTGKS